jgi:hypothetical protein
MSPKERKKETESSTDVNTGGGAYIGGDVTTSGIDFGNREKNIIGGEGSVVIGGNVTDSVVVTGDGNVITYHLALNVFEPLYRLIDQMTVLPEEKSDLKAELKEIEAELHKGEKADEAFLLRRLRAIQRMSPDLLGVTLSVLANPTSGTNLTAKKVAEKMMENLK